MTTSTLAHTASEKAVLDLGCTNHLIKSSTKCTDTIPTTNGLRVGIANGQIMQGSHNATLNLPHLPLKLSSRAQQTGRFPVTSSKGNKYIMVVYDYDSTAIILAEPIKNRSEHEILRAYSKLHQDLTDRGLKSQLQKLDNECSAALKQFMRKANVEFQLVPPYNHRQNAAERAIEIWKDHFVAGLASLDPTFPMHLWCPLIEQCTQTLNLMHPSRINPRLSAEAQLNGAFDYNKTLLAPPSTKVLIHETPNRRCTWAVHGVDGWYVGGSPEHYRCYRVYATKTRAERIARTMEFFHITDKCLNSPQRMPPFGPPSTSTGPFAIPPLRPP
jgi:hypothetical protein